MVATPWQSAQSSAEMCLGGGAALPHHPHSFPSPQRACPLFKGETAGQGRLVRRSRPGMLNTGGGDPGDDEVPDEVPPGACATLHNHAAAPALAAPVRQHAKMTLGCTAFREIGPSPRGEDVPQSPVLQQAVLTDHIESPQQGTHCRQVCAPVFASVGHAATLPAVPCHHRQCHGAGWRLSGMQSDGSMG